MEQPFTEGNTEGITGPGGDVEERDEYDPAGEAAGGRRRKVLPTVYGERKFNDFRVDSRKMCNSIAKMVEDGDLSAYGYTSDVRQKNRLFWEQKLVEAIDRNDVDRAKAINRVLHQFSEYDLKLAVEADAAQRKDQGGVTQKLVLGVMAMPGIRDLKGVKYIQAEPEGTDAEDGSADRQPDTGA